MFVDLVAGYPRPMSFRDALLQVPAAGRDDWVNARLGYVEVPDDAADLPPEAMMSFASGVDEVLALVDELPLGPDDVFCDLGSGAGRAALLVHLLSGARCRGIEAQAHLVAFANDRARALRLPDVRFVHGDAATVEGAGAGDDANVFFLYAPARGALLARLLLRVEEAARRRPITVAAVAVDLRAARWLRPRRTSCETLTLYETR